MLLNGSIFHQKAILETTSQEGLDVTCLEKVRTWYQEPKFLWEPKSTWKIRQ